MKSKLIKICVLIFACLFLWFCVYTIKINSNKHVHIIFSTDQNYKEYTKVAIKSAISTKHPKSIYHINVLCVDIPENECKEFENFAEENASVVTVNKKISYISHIGNYEIDHYVTRTDLFKFVFDEIFTDIDKALYIDSDTLILKDLRKLYNTDISNKYLAAVKKIEPEKAYRSGFIGKYFIRYEYYYNCGVLLMNLDKIRKDNIQRKLISSKNDDMIRDLQTQRVYNIVIPLKTIKQLPPIYNDVARYDNDYIDTRQYKFFRTYFPFSLIYRNIEEVDKSAVIVHYAGKRKPWYGIQTKYYDTWWKYAKSINPNWKIIKSPYEDK